MLGLWRSDRKAGREREWVSEREGALERKREGGREAGRESSKNFPLKLVRSFHCKWGGVTAWTEPQRLCNAAPQRTSIQLCYQQLQISSVDSNMYSPYCLTQVWKKIAVLRLRRFAFFPLPPGVARLRFVFTVRGLQCCVACRAATCHLLRTKELFPTLLSFPR